MVGNVYYQSPHERPDAMMNSIGQQMIQMSRSLSHHIQNVDQQVKGLSSTLMGASSGVGRMNVSSAGSAMPTLSASPGSMMDNMSFTQRLDYLSQVSRPDPIRDLRTQPGIGRELLFGLRMTSARARRRMTQDDVEAQTRRNWWERYQATGDAIKGAYEWAPRIFGFDTSAMVTRVGRQIEGQSNRWLRAPYGEGLTGSGFTRDQSRDMAREMLAYRRGDGREFNRNEFREIISVASSMGQFDDTTSIEDFRKNYQNLIQGVSRAMKVLKSSYQESTAIMAEFNKHGVRDTDQAMDRVRLQSAITGLSAAHLTEFAGTMAPHLRQMMPTLSSEQAFGMATRLAGKGDPTVGANVMGDQGMWYAFTRQQGEGYGVDLEAFNRWSKGMMPTRELMERQREGARTISHEDILIHGPAAMANMPQYYAANMESIKKLVDINRFREHYPGYTEAQAAGILEIPIDQRDREVWEFLGSDVDNAALMEAGARQDIETPVAGWYEGLRRSVSEAFGRSRRGRMGSVDKIEDRLTKDLLSGVLVQAKKKKIDSFVTSREDAYKYNEAVTNVGNLLRSEDYQKNDIEMSDLEELGIKWELTTEQVIATMNAEGQTPQQMADALTMMRRVHNVDGSSLIRIQELGEEDRRRVIGEKARHYLSTHSNISAADKHKRSFSVGGMIGSMASWATILGGSGAIGGAALGLATGGVASGPLAVTGGLLGVGAGAVWGAGSYMYGTVGDARGSEAERWRHALLEDVLKGEYDIDDLKGKGLSEIGPQLGVSITKYGGQDEVLNTIKDVVDALEEYSATGGAIEMIGADPGLQADHVNVEDLNLFLRQSVILLQQMTNTITNVDRSINGSSKDGGATP